MPYVKRRITRILSAGAALVALSGAVAQASPLSMNRVFGPAIIPVIKVQGMDGSGSTAQQPGGQEQLKKFLQQKKNNAEKAAEKENYKPGNAVPPFQAAKPAQPAKPAAPAQPIQPAPENAQKPQPAAPKGVEQKPRKNNPSSDTSPAQLRKTNPIAKVPEQPKKQNPIAKVPGQLEKKKPIARVPVEPRKKSPIAKMPAAPGTSGSGISSAAPLTDSGKEDLRDHLRRKKVGDGKLRENPRARVEDPNGKKANPIAKAPPPPPSDSAAQGKIRIGKIDRVDRDEGRRVKGEPRFKRPRDRDNIVERIGDRLIIRLDSGGLTVTTDDRRDRRIKRRAEEVYTEELRNGLIRETVIRPNGVRIVTIYNEYGYVVRRSRIGRDGREIILVYVPRERWDDLRDPGYDAGADLPPLVLTMPREEYILEAENADRGDYREFLDQAPVEQVERLYSIDEVTRSARLRDMVRRIDLDTVTFEFGSAEISESEVDELEALGSAMLDLLEQNPGEVFLIEGHTDAVGTQAANLVLSDKRAETVAEIMTDYFKVPPENIVTQGYGESYLKVNTEAPERENRRVAVRRITPLVAPADTAAYVK